MKRAAFTLLLLLSGCDDPAPQAAEIQQQAEMERRMSALEQRISALEAENLSLRMEMSRARSGSTLPAPDPSRPMCRGAGMDYAISRAEVNTILDDSLALLAREARAVPFFEDGVSKGFKLFSIRAGGSIASCGFKNGDVVESVNGYEVASPEKALEAYSKMKGAARADFAILRQGSPMVLSITIE